MRGILLFLILFCLFPAFSQEQREVLEIEKKLFELDTLPVEITVLPRKINTPYSEYNGILLKDSLFFFTSLRSENRSDYENIFEQYWRMKIYYTKLTKRGFSKVESMPDMINHKKYFNANFSFNANANHLYFARCRPQIESDLKCELWESRLNKNSWTKPEKLDEKINLPEYHVTQPFIVEYEDYNVLYFSSNRPNGFGGMDLWYAICKNGQYEEPINLGSLINTSGDEITPFYDIKNQTLYFSSDQHPGGGGQDIFKSEGALSSWSLPENMGHPVNSAYHDYYFTVNYFDLPKSGYFCSNRPQKKSQLDDTCCYDIFSWIWHDPQTDLPQEEKADTITVVDKIRAELPLTLYFHNDMPDPRSMDTITQKDYATLFEDYICLTEEFKKEYSKGLKGKEKVEAEEKIDSFFKDSVERGIEKLELFSEYLLQELENGSSLSITISGFASSLHDEEYNRRLTLRRISSLKNYLNEYRNGALLPYINGMEKNRLVILSDPKGSEEAIKKNVSRNARDKRNSVYSVEASLERRIQITEIGIRE